MEFLIFNRYKRKGTNMFNVGDHIVYPMHGAGIIDAIEEKGYIRRKSNHITY